MPATVQSVLAMSRFMQQITRLSQVLSNCVQETLSCVDSRCRLIKTDRFEFLIVVLLAGLKDAMQICGKLPGQETFVDKFAIKETDGTLVFAWDTVDHLQQSQHAKEHGVVRTVNNRPPTPSCFEQSLRVRQTLDCLADPGLH
jgi:hypothetical protein